MWTAPGPGDAVITAETAEEGAHHDYRTDIRHPARGLPDEGPRRDEEDLQHAARHRPVCRRAVLRRLPCRWARGRPRPERDWRADLLLGRDDIAASVQSLVAAGATLDEAPHDVG